MRVDEGVRERLDVRAPQALAPVDDDGDLVAGVLRPRADLPEDALRVGDGLQDGRRVHRERPLVDVVLGVEHLEAAAVEVAVEPVAARGHRRLPVASGADVLELDVVGDVVVPHVVLEHDELAVAVEGRRNRAVVVGAAREPALLRVVGGIGHEIDVRRGEDPVDHHVRRLRLVGRHDVAVVHSDEAPGELGLDDVRDVRHEVGDHGGLALVEVDHLLFGRVARAVQEEAVAVVPALRHRRRVLARVLPVLPLAERLGHPKARVRALVHPVHVPLGVDAPAGAHRDDAVAPRLRLDVGGELRQEALHLGAVGGRGRRGPRDAVRALVAVADDVASGVADPLLRMRREPLRQLHADQHQDARVGRGGEQRGGLVAERGELVRAGRLLVFGGPQVELVDRDPEIGHLRDRLLAVVAVDAALVEHGLDQRPVERDLRHAVGVDDPRVGRVPRQPRGTGRALLLRRAVVHVGRDVPGDRRPRVADLRRRAPGGVVEAGIVPVARRDAVRGLEGLRVAVDDDMAAVRELDVPAEDDSRLAHVVRREHREDVAPLLQAVAVHDRVAREGRAVQPVQGTVVDVHLDGRPPDRPGHVE